MYQQIASESVALAASRIFSGGDDDVESSKVPRKAIEVNEDNEGVVPLVFGTGRIAGLVGQTGPTYHDAIRNSNKK